MVKLTTRKFNQDIKLPQTECTSLKKKMLTDFTDIDNNFYDNIGYVTKYVDPVLEDWIKINSVLELGSKLVQSWD